MDLIEYIVQGMLLGAAYGLVALPISIVYTTTHSLDAAVGSHAVFAAVTAAAVGGATGVALGLAAGMLSTSVVGLMYLALRRRGEVEPITFVLATFGVAFALQGLVLLLHGRDPVVGHAFTRNWDVLGLSLYPQSIINFFVGLIIMVVMAFALSKTSLGRALRATADNAQGAELTGLSVGKLQFAAIMIGGVLASLAGILLLYTTGVTYTAGMHITLTAIAAAVLFGFRGPVHGFAGGIIFGVVQSLVSGYTSGGLAAAIPFLFIFIVLAMGRAVPVVSRP